MRFGIMAMQLGLIVPAGGGGDARALREQVARYDIAGLVARLADAGFSLVELNTDLELFLPACFDAAARDRLAALAEQRGLSYTSHLPLWSIDVSTLERHVREASVASVVDALRRMAELRPEVFVLHSTGALAAEFARMPLPPTARSLVLDRFQHMARESLAAILKATGVAPRRVALENAEFPLELTVALAEEFDCSLCLDTGHLLAGYSGTQSFASAVELMLPRLAEVHLHDGYLRSEGGAARAADHLRLGLGDLPLEWLLDRLASVGFGGPVVLELSVEDALASLAAIGRLRPEVLGGGNRG